MRKGLAALLLLLLLTAGISGAAAETALKADPGELRVGEVTDIQVLADEGAASVTYMLSRGRETVFEGEADTHFEASFRPRAEGRYILQVQVSYEDGRTENASAVISVSGKAETQQGPEVVYSQKDGWWAERAYSKSELQQAGCAIFTLSHALQRMGWSGEDILPEKLAETYAGCYTEGGTANARLITRASEVYGYSTKKDLFTDAADIADALKCGDLFSFAIVNGHIALISGLDEDGDKVKIVDSAPGATFERIKNGKIYYTEGGKYREASEPGDIPGARYYFETGTWGGLEYYMDLAYVARRGARLIRPGWFRVPSAAGRTGYTPTAVGTAVCTVNINGTEEEIPTFGALPDGMSGKMAVVSQKYGAKLLNSEGKRIAGVPACTIVPVIRTEEDRVYVIYRSSRGYLALEDVELTDPVEKVRRGTISVRGDTGGRSTVKTRFTASVKDRVIAEWKTGTRVAVIGYDNSFYLVEANGLRVWVQEDYVTPDEGDGINDGQKINEGE